MRLKGLKDNLILIYMEENEKWKDIEDFENYEVSNLGKVRNSKTGRILKTCISGGYAIVGISSK
jgi:hypothetical protein